MTTRLNFDVTAYLAESLPAHFHESDRGFLVGSCLWHRDGSRPNLAVWDSGAYFCNSCGARGNVVSLVQRIERFPTYEDAAAWLDEMYGVDDDDDESESVELCLGADETSVAKKKPSIDWQPPDESLLDDCRWRHAYLGTRGISEEIQRMFDVGYDKASRTITLPWRDRKGALVTVKHRSVRGKAFWYSPRVPTGVKSTLLYCLHAVRASTVYICEAEIDSLSLWQSGREAVALGGNNMSASQARELALAGVERVVLACDRDKGGEAAHESIRKRVAAYGIECVEALWPEDAMIEDENGEMHPVKDTNELLKIGRIDELQAHTIGLSIGGMGAW